MTTLSTGSASVRTESVGLKLAKSLRMTHSTVAFDYSVTTQLYPTDGSHTPITFGVWVSYMAVLKVYTQGFLTNHALLRFAED